MYYRGKHMNMGDRREMGLKRQRVIDQGSSYYGSTPPASSYMYTPPPPPPPYSHVNQPPLFPVVRLRGLPFDCSETDIAAFFHGLDIVDILFIHKNGKFAGEVYCVLGYAFQVGFALQRNRQIIGGRYVEVFRTKRQEYYKAIANEVSDTLRAKWLEDDSVEHTGVLRLRGLPFSASKDDIIDFFKTFLLPEESINFTVNSEGRATGEAFVKFKSAEESKAAMVKDRKSLGRRYIELFPASLEQWEDAVQSGCNHVPRSSNDVKDEDTTVLRMRGLPFSAGKDDILDFFSDFKLTEDSIHITVNSGGRPTGEAFIEFGSVEDAKSALSKDRMTLGSRYIELFTSSTDELKDAASRGR